MTEPIRPVPSLRQPASILATESAPDVDGALVGGASLDPADFAAIVEIAARAG